MFQCQIQILSADVEYDVGLSTFFHFPKRVSKGLVVRELVQLYDQVFVFAFEELLKANYFWEETKHS